MRGISTFVLIACLSAGCQANPDAKRLFEDILNGYNKLSR